MNALLIAGLGAGAGIAQARLLAAAARGRDLPGGALLRLGLVAAVLVVAASAHQLWAAVAAWALAFASSACSIAGRPT